MFNLKRFVLFLALICASTSFLSAQDMTAKNKATLQTAYDALNRKDWAAFSAQCAPGFTDLNVGPAPATGIKAALELYQQFQAAFPDFQIKVNEIIPASSTRFLLRVTVSGTHTGAFMMLPPTGKSIHFDDVDIVEFDAAGRAVSHAVTNSGQLLRQIGYGSMLNPNTAIVMDIYEKFGKGDVPAILAGSSDNLVFDIQDRMFDSKPRTFKGKTEVAGFFKELVSKFEYSKFQPIRFVADGEDVFILIDAEYKLNASGKMYKSLYTHHFKVADGKITYFRGVDDFQQMN